MSTTLPTKRVTARERGRVRVNFILGEAEA